MAKVIIADVVALKPTEVKLDKFCSAPHSIWVRPLSVTARARIQMLSAEGTRYATKQAKKSLNIEAIEMAMGEDVVLDIRETKLKDCFVKHDFTSPEGTPLEWDKDFRDALDEMNPLILTTVIDVIGDISYPDEGEGDPTSAAGSAKK